MAELSADGLQLEMISVAVALKEIGYDIQVISEVVENVALWNSTARI